MPKNQSTSALKYNFLPKGRLLYFNEEAHKYTDDLGNGYTSCTTLIKKYHEEFDIAIAEACERIGKNPSHPKYPRYKGKTAKQIVYEWKQIAEAACLKGTAKHNYLENTIKSSNGYKRNAEGFINDRIYTIDDIIKGHSYGRLSLSFFVKTGIDHKYPKIFSLISDLVKDGFRIYAEIGVYDPNLLISGLIDILLVRGNEFIILDWKTNKAPIRFEAGYYDKDNNGLLKLDTFIKTDKYFHAPINHLPDSIGNHYTLQLSIYDYLVESFGLRNIGNILCHIRTVENSICAFGKEEEEVIEFLPIKYLKKDVEVLMIDHSRKNLKHNTLF